MHKRVESVTYRPTAHSAQSGSCPRFSTPEELAGHRGGQPTEAPTTSISWPAGLTAPRQSGTLARGVQQRIAESRAALPGV